MDDLFTDNQKGRIAVHLATDSLVIILFADWYKGGLNYKVLVPMKDEKDKRYFVMPPTQRKNWNLWISG